MEARQAKQWLLNRWDWVFIAVILATSLLFLPVKSVPQGDSACNTLLNALSIHLKGEPEFVRRGPVFYGLIAMSFSLFGVTVEHAVWVTRIFVSFNLALVFFMTKSMLNVRTAVLSSILVFFSYSINVEAAKLELDNVMPFFMLLFLWLSWMSAKRNDMRLAIAAGATLGLGFLTKEASILYAPLALVPFIFKDQWNRRNLLLTLIQGAVCVFVVSIWFAYAWSRVASWSLLFGAASPECSSEHIATNMPYWQYVLHYFILKAPINAWKYFTDFIVPNFPNWPLIAAAIVFAVHRAIRRKSLELTYLLAGLLFFSPIAVYQGGIGERLGQCYVMFLIYYILLAYAVVELALWMSKRYANIAWLRKPGRVACACVSLMVCLQLFNPFCPVNSTLRVWVFRYNRLMLTDLIASHLPLGMIERLASKLGAPKGVREKISKIRQQAEVEGFQVGERFGEHVQEASNWLIENVGRDQTIMCDGLLTHSLPFCTRLKFKIAPFEGAFKSVNFSYDDPDNYADISNQRILAVTTYHNFRDASINRYRTFYFLPESTLLSSVKETNPDYLFVFKSATERERYTQPLADYFKRQPGLEKVFENDGATIYRTNGCPLTPLDEFTFQTNDEFDDDVAWLKKTHPEEYGKFSALFESIATK